MGYQTQYDLQVVCDPNAELGVDNPYTIQQMLDWCETNKYTQDDGLGLILACMKEGCAHEPMKWYKYEEEMKAFSAAFPDVLFCLSGEGEEDDDKWKCYFMNGKMQLCIAKITIEYPEFDPSLLE